MTGGWRETSHVLYPYYPLCSCSRTHDACILAMQFLVLIPAGSAMYLFPGPLSSNYITSNAVVTCQSRQ
ncbi:hypothetical protein VTH06DRAFT_3121 [Thermothelomyces fergusii]